MTVNPPMCSLPSANGPSVVSTSPPSGRSTVAELGGCRPPAKTQAPAAWSSSWSARTSLLTFSMSTSGGGVSPAW